MPTVTNAYPSKPDNGDALDGDVIAARIDALYAVINALDNANFDPAAGQELAVAKILKGTTGQVLVTGASATEWGTVADAGIGNRTVDQTLASPANTGTLTSLLSWLAGRIKAISGETNWYDAPDATIATLVKGGIGIGIGGTLATETGKNRIIVPVGFSGTIASVSVSAGTAPTGASLIIDLNKNGTTMFTTQANRPTIPAGSTAVVTSVAPDVTSITAGDVLNIDIDQVGSTVAGAELAVTINVTRT